MPPPDATMAALTLTLVRRLRSYRGPAAGLVLVLAVQTAFQTGLPLGLGLLVDEAIVPRDPGRLALIMGVAAVAAVLFAVAGVAGDKLYSTISARVLNDLRRDMFDQLQRLPLASFGRLRGGDLASRFSADLAAIDVALTVSLPTALLSSGVLAVAVTLLVALQWQLALLTVAMLPLATLGPRFVAGRAAVAGVARRAQASRIGAALQESVNGRFLVRVLGLRPHVTGQFEHRLDEMFALSRRASFLGYLMERLPNLALLGAQLLVVGVAASLVIDGTITLGTFVAFNGLLVLVTEAVRGITAALPGLIGAVAGHHRVMDVLSEPSEEPDGSLGDPVPPLQHGVALHGVTLAYGSGPPVLDDVTVTIARGAFVALVGGSGAGKTSVLDLLLRLRHPTAGTVRFDDRDVRELDLSQLRSRMSVVPQEDFLFDVGVAENVRLARPQATDEEVQQACRAVGIDELVSALPEGYATKAGERGGRFSAGQRQRIAIARALLRQPDVLLLDEPTAALDPHTEAEVMDALRRAADGRTTICATHRLSTLRPTDHVVLLERGRVVEQGTVDALRMRGGAFAALWEKQSGFAIDQVVAVSPQRLGAVPLLATLDGQQLAAIARLLGTVHVPAGQDVHVEGDPAESFHLIARGHLEVLRRGPDGELRRIATMHDGDHFGEIALLRGGRRTATVRTLEPTTLLVLSRARFEALLAEYPAVRERLTATLADRLAHDAGQVSGLPA